MTQDTSDIEPQPIELTGEVRTPRSRWGQGRRLEFIEFRLVWEGQINRSDLTEFFGISVPQASLDLAKYQELAPRNLEYDRSERVYRVTREFAPVFSGLESSSVYLNQLLAVNSEMMPKELSFIGAYPPFDAVLSHAQRVPAGMLALFLRLIRTRKSISIRYQSMTRPDPIERRVTPHAIAYSGTRWHVRAFSHERRRFRDFVFTRILEASDEQPSDVDSPIDLEWETRVNLVLVPHHGLSENQRHAIELDYDMKDGRREVTCRRALLIYMVERLGLIDRAAGADAEALQIELENREEIEALLGRPLSPRSTK